MRKARHRIGYKNQRDPETEVVMGGNAVWKSRNTFLKLGTYRRRHPRGCRGGKSDDR